MPTDGAGADSPAAAPPSVGAARGGAPRHAASAPLSDEHLARLRGLGEVRTTAAGEVLCREGDHGYDFIVIGSD